MLSKAGSHFCLGLAQTFFHECWKPPCLHFEELLRLAEKQYQRVLGSCRRSAATDIDNAVWSAFLAEVDKGWAAGSFTMEQAEEQTLGLFVLSRRFGAQQKNKVRAIDDFCASRINACAGLKGKV